MVFPWITSVFTPLRQAMICFALAILGMLICHLAFRGDSVEFMAAFCGIMFFSIMNPVISIFNETFAKYTWPSWGLFFALLILLLLLARAISGISIMTPEMGSYRMMLTSIVFFYITASLLVRLIRMIWEYAENDEN